MRGMRRPSVLGRPASVEMNPGGTMKGHRARRGAIAVFVLGLALLPSAANAYSDRDKDGIEDAQDACPDEAGPRNANPKLNGCPIGPWGAPKGASDRDHDGVADIQDACPDTPGVKTSDPKTNGCPAPTGCTPTCTPTCDCHGVPPVAPTTCSPPGPATCDCHGQPTTPAPPATPRSPTTTPTRDS